MLTTNIILKRIDKSPDGEVVFLYFELKKILNFQEGQFVILESIDYQRDGKTIKRAYSIATTKKHLEENNEIWFIVKKASEDGLSYYLTKKIQIGDQVVLSWPAGHFVDPGNYSKYLFVSIGSGVAALHPQYIHLTQENGDYDKIVNIFWERYHKTILPLLENLFSEQSDKVRNFLHFSREKELPEGTYKGYVQESLEEALKFLNGTDFLAFLCGKQAMINEIKEKLLAAWLSKEQIIFEMY